MDEKERADRLEAMIDTMAGTIVDLRAFMFESNESLRSAYSIAQREGVDTNWEAFRNKIKDLLDRQHEYYYRGKRGLTPAATDRLVGVDYAAPGTKDYSVETPAPGNGGG